MPQRVWADTKDRPLETQVGEILANLVLAGPMLVKQRHEREEAERQRRAEEYRRYQEAERRRLDNNRWRRLTELAAQWRQADEVRRFLDALEQHPDVAGNLANGEPVADWLAWARSRLAAFDPLASGPVSVFEDLMKVTAWAYRE